MTDKVLEQMGAFVAFRRCYYVGESPDYKGVDMAEAFRQHFAYRMDRIKRTDFPESVSRLVKYQWKWLVDFSVLLSKDELWALNLGRHMYEAAKRRERIGQAIASYNPENKEAEKYKREATDYLEGKKFREFEKLINHA